MPSAVVISKAIQSEVFENPTTFRLDSFADDNSTRHLYSLMIRPAFLPVGISTSNRIIKPGYETYQPVIEARQFGLGQVPPHFHIHHLVESRADLPNGLTSSRCYSMFDNLHIPIPADLSFTPSSIDFLHMVGNVENSYLQKSSRSSTAAN